MSNTVFQLKRSSVSGVVPTTSSITSGELAINLADKKVFSTNGTVVFEIGSNLTNLAVSGQISANGSTGNSGYVLTTSGATGNAYWSSPGAVVNTSAQYTWSNTQSFTNTITFANTNINNIVLSGNTSNVSAINFNTSAGLASGSVGSLFWHSADGSLNLQMDSNVIGTINESLYYYVKASSAITIGQVCMFTGAVGASGVLTSAPANSSVTDGTYIMGIAAESIALNGFGYIQSYGSLKGFDTTAFTTGSILWFDPANTGGLTATQPVSPNPVVQVAAVTNSGAGGSGSIYIRITPTDRLAHLQDVTITSPANGNVLVYNGATNLWNNASAANNSTNFAGQPQSYYTNVSNITTGTLAYARLPANVVFWSNTNTFTADQTFSANIYANNVNAVTFSTGTTFTANSTLVNAASISIYGSGSALNLANTTSGYIKFGGASSAGLGAPSVTSYSAGVRTVLYDSVSASSPGYAIGIASGVLWYGVDTLAAQHAWYANTTQFMTANTTGLYHTGTVNAASHTVGTSFTANSTVVNAVSYNISTTFIANTTGLYHTGTVNAASHTVGTAFTANSTVVNAVSYTVGTSFIANSTVVNAASFTIGSSFIANTTGLQVGYAITPSADNSYNLGSAALRWANIYTGDLQLSNEGSGGNDVDHTTGSWTIQEGEDNLYILNRKTGKRYMFVLKEV